MQGKSILLMLVCLLGLSMVSAAFAPAPPPVVKKGHENLVHWNSRRDLRWKDFRGNPLTHSPMVASTFTQLSYSWNCVNDVPQVEVFAHFNPEKSWVRGNPTPELLRHEQYHFHITELFARQLRRDFLELEMACSYSSKEISNHYHDLLDQWRTMQSDYDAETRHSMNKKAQEKWETRIDAALEKLAGFSSDNFIVNR